MGFTKHTFTATINGGSLSVAIGVHIPAANPNGRKHIPILFYHGQGKRGTPGNVAGLDNVATEGLPKLIASASSIGSFYEPGGDPAETWTFAIFFPQCSTAFGTWPIDYTDACLDWIEANYGSQLEMSKLSVTGLSQGGGGSLHAAVSRGSRIASCFSICPGYYIYSYADKITFVKGGPKTHIYHSATDTTANINTTSRLIVPSINSERPVTPLQYIEFAGVSVPNDGTNLHGIWDVIYSNTNRNFTSLMSSGDMWVKKYYIFELMIPESTNRYIKP